MFLGDQIFRKFTVIANNVTPSIQFLFHLKFLLVLSWYLSHLSRLTTKPTKWLCAQRRLGSAWASAHSDQSLRSALCGPKISSCRQRRLWSDWADAQADLSLHQGAHAILLVLSWGGSFSLWDWMGVGIGAITFYQALERNRTEFQNRSSVSETSWLSVS